MEKDTTDLNHNLLRCKASWAFEKRSLKETVKKKRQELIQHKGTRHRHQKWVNHQVKNDALQQKSWYRTKLQRSQEILEQLMEEWIRESNEKHLKEEELNSVAKFRVKENEGEKTYESAAKCSWEENSASPRNFGRNYPTESKIHQENCLEERNHFSLRQSWVVKNFINRKQKKKSE